MNYEDARPLIKSGDLIFFDAKTTPQKIITLVTGGQASHCGIATWMCDSVGTPRLMLIESFLGGCRLINLRSYARRPMTVINVGLHWPLVEDYTLIKTGSVGYSGFDFLVIGIRDVLLRLNLRHWANNFVNTEGEVCSEMVADVVIKAGLADDLGTLWSPNSLYVELQDRNLVQSTLRVDKF